VAFIRVNHAAVGSEKAFQDNVKWQRQQCQEHAERHGLAVIREYVDKSGGVSIERRPVLREMLAELHALHDATHVITTDEARITRRANELVSLIQNPM
jgi:DNA invertase Pin-like site-specific DNA recombinase